jgi:signal transduction histidine kinase
VSTIPDDESVVVRVEGPTAPLPLTRSTETQLFGIGREALANVVKHAEAQTACVRVTATPASVVLEVVDDGRGFDPDTPHAGHFGLDSMRSRADELGADLRIISAPGRGTVVRVELSTESGRNGG